MSGRVGKEELQTDHVGRFLPVHGSQMLGHIPNVFGGARKICGFSRFPGYFLGGEWLEGSGTVSGL